MKINKIEQLLSIIEEDFTFIEIPMMPLYEVHKYLESIGFNCDDVQTNGNDIDFWWYSIHPEYGTWIFSGSLWSGNFKFEKYETDK